MVFQGFLGRPQAESMRSGEGETLIGGPNTAYYRMHDTAYRIQDTAYRMHEYMKMQGCMNT